MESSVGMEIENFSFSMQPNEHKDKDKKPTEEKKEDKK